MSKIIIVTNKILDVWTDPSLDLRQEDSIVIQSSVTQETAIKKEAFRPKPAIDIRAFRPEDAKAFRVLNEDWIAKHFGLEEKDRITLGDPEGHILQKGGHIFMAFSEDGPVGCCALLLVRPGVYEVAKMTVAEEYRGYGIGRRVLAYTIEQGKALGAESLYLETNRKLVDAIHLYEAMGFHHLPPDRVVPSPYVRANVFMELKFR
jgi:GNAT superfamily N-acetyltransferase